MLSTVQSFLLLLLVAACASFHLRTLHEDDAHFYTCLEESGLSREDVFRSFGHPRFRSPSEEIEEEISISTEMLCFAKCVAERKEVITEDGSIDVEKLREAVEIHMHPAQVEEVMECVENVGNVEECEDVLPLVRCFLSARRHRRRSFNHYGFHPRTLNEDDPHVQTCLDETGLLREDVFRSFPHPRFQDPSERIEEDALMSREMLCFAKCVAEKKEVIRDDGSIHVEKLREMAEKHAHPAQVEEVMECVESIGNVGECEDVMPLLRCFLSNRRFRRRVSNHPAGMEPPHMTEEVQDCLKETGLDVETIADQFPDGPEGKPKEGYLCFLKCVMNKQGELKPDGTLDIEKVKENMKDPRLEIPADKAPEMLECLKKLGKFETCEDVWKLDVCQQQFKFLQP